MKNGTSTFFSLLFLLLIFQSCRNDNHFISDKNYREKVRKQFESQKKLAVNREKQLFGVFDSGLSLTEKEALQFLYAFLPLSDLADYDGSFYLKNVRASLAARDTFSWGKSIPEEIFRHFVLPVRINNENLDSSRWLFFMELKDRIKPMNMKDAVLEVNHWCHEKVTYRGTDGRTSSPLATVKTAYGRCGEESTFTTAALRAVGIPARQCYTPRWAHSDDNHAWVEVWIDGKWHFIGACEPEPDLDIAWFTNAAKRTMLVNTNVFGDYSGPEDVLIKDPRFTKINILSNYTTTKKIVVKVTDENNRPVDSATTGFLLYNYAEFFPLQKTFTDQNGIASFTTGLGDLIVWATKNGHFGYQKVSVNNCDTAYVTINKKPGERLIETFDLVPPPETKNMAIISDSVKEINIKRFEFENTLRTAYESTFIDSSKTIRLAPTLKMNADTLWYFLKRSRGNWRDIIDFISSTPIESKPLVFPLLRNISEKDLHDVTSGVLLDNILYSQTFSPLTNDPEIFEKYILSPRIDIEWLKPFKSYFQEKTAPEMVDKFRNDPEQLVLWLKKRMKIDPSANYSRAPLTPIGSYELQVTDLHSMGILFVAMCRSFGIPARLEPGTRVPQYLAQKGWSDVFFEKPPEISNQRGSLVLLSDKENNRIPEYYVHYTIEKFSEGFFQSLDFESDPQVKNFPFTLQVAPGYYLLVTGVRLQDGTVLAKMQSFNVEENKKTEMKVTLRKDPSPLPVIAKVEIKTLLAGISENRNPNLHHGKGIVLAFLEPEKEPTQHFIADLKLMQQDFSKWEGNILLFFVNEKEKSAFLNKNKAELPAGIQYLVNTPGTYSKLSGEIHREVGQRLPLIIYIHQKGEINYLSEGYRIGTCEALIRMTASENTRTKH